MMRRRPSRRSGTRARVLAAVLGGVLASSSGARAIVGGAVDASDPAVVVLDVGGFRYCSGALIGATTVLTAGHCVLDAALPLSVSIVGDDGTTAIASFGVVERARHPDYTQEGAPYDVALLRLDAAPTGVVPLQLSTHVLDNDDVGTTLRHVGFGIDDEEAGSGRGSKRSVALAVTSVDTHFVYGGDATHQTCDGDSGGPALRVDDDGVERIVAVTSDGPSCHEIGWDVRLDDVQAFVDDTLATFEPAQAAPRSAGCATLARGGDDDASELALFALLPVALVGSRLRRMGRVQRRSA